MTDAILGHDVDGRELRAGDRVEVVDSYTGLHVGATTTVRSRVNSRHFYTNKPEPGVSTDLPSGFFGGAATLNPAHLRLINSGRELFDQCAREADKMPTESTIRQRMPWTEPEGS